MNELPPSVRAVARAATGPVLAFDLAAIDATMAAIARAAHAHGVRVLLAVKAFPHPDVIALAASRLDGLDLAGPEERAAAASAGAGARTISITDPGLDAMALPAGPVTVTCESAAQVAAVRAARPDAAIALRVSISAIAPGDAAVGALQAGDGHRRSRFGVEPDAACDAEAGASGPTLGRAAVLRGATDHWRALREMADAARGARIGLHVHAAGVVPTSPARWAAIAAALVEVAARAAIAPAFVDLGGGWHGVADRLDAAIGAVRAVVPAAIDVVIEPGRLFSHGAGYALGRVRAVRRLVDRELRVVSLSRIAHLRWSPVELVTRAPAPGAGRKVTFAGATCFEDDVIGDWITDDAAQVGDEVAWSGVTGYSAAWNRGFAGVPAARVMVIR